MSALNPFDTQIVAANEHGALLKDLNVLEGLLAFSEFTMQF